jgi:hypothetical protein
LTVVLRFFFSFFSFCLFLSLCALLHQLLCLCAAFASDAFPFCASLSLPTLSVALTATPLLAASSLSRCRFISFGCLSLCLLLYRLLFLYAAFASDSVGCVDSNSIFGCFAASPLTLYLFRSPVALSLSDACCFALFTCYRYRYSHSWRSLYLFRWPVALSLSGASRFVLITCYCYRYYCYYCYLPLPLLLLLLLLRARIPPFSSSSCLHFSCQDWTATVRTASSRYT